MGGGCVSAASYRGRGRITRWDLWLGGAAFCAVLALGALALYADQVLGWWRQNQSWAVVGAIVSVYIAFTNRWVRKFAWRLLRALGDRVGVREPTPLRRPWVIDGDTIEDLETKIRYRLANIDAPETGDNAKCFNERRVGEMAKAAAIRLVRKAGVVSVERTWRFDRYNRTVAYVLVDGIDLGETLVNLGLACRWRGRRAPWCGGGGPLVKLAERRGEKLACAACVNWRK
jgi:endonuclease YncB( thermonuclease family)